MIHAYNDELIVLLRIRIDRIRSLIQSITPGTPFTDDIRSRLSAVLSQLEAQYYSLLS